MGLFGTLSAHKQKEREEFAAALELCQCATYKTSETHFYNYAITLWI